MSQMQFENQTDCKTLQVYQSYAASYEKAFHTQDWSSVADHFSEDMIYQLESPPIISVESHGKDNVASFYKTHHDKLDRPFEGRRQRGNIHYLLVKERYLKLCTEIIYSFPDVPEISVPYEEEVWLNENDLIEKIIVKMPASKLQHLGDYLESHLGVSIGP